MRQYLWQRQDWPEWTWDASAVLEALDATRKKQYTLLGALQIGAAAERARAVADALAATAIETSSIEGEILNPEMVRSSVARRFGLPGGARQDDRTEGVVSMTLDATTGFDQPLTTARLFRWHSDLFPTFIGSAEPTILGGWRRPEADPMQVLSGPVGRERVHFQAPPAKEVPAEMGRFLEWFEESNGKINGLVRVAIAHLWFLTIHPFEDGNGRIGRAIADMALAQDERMSERFYSVSAQISLERRQYYDHIETAQRGDTDVTPWVVWLIECIARAVDASSEQVAKAVRAIRFWDRWEAFSFNDRQRKVLLRLLGDFDGALTLRKYLALAKTTRATAQRDIADLVGAGILIPNGIGRATSYEIATVA